MKVCVIYCVNHYTSLCFCLAGYDCPPFANVFEYVSCIAGASLSLADCLMREEAQVAINWYGGWHHGKKYAMEGERERE